MSQRLPARPPGANEASVPISSQRRLTRSSRRLLLAGVATTLLGLGATSASAQAAPTLFAGGTTSVTPIDAATGVKQAPITGFANAASSPFTYLALSPDQKTGWFVSSSGVTPFDIASGTRGTLIPAASGMGVAASPDGNTVYETNTANRTLVPIDTATKTAGTPIPLGAAGGTPTANSVVVSPDSSTVWVGTDAGVLKVDPVARTVSAPIVVPGNGSNGFGDLVVSPDGSTLFVGANAQGIYTIDTATKAVGALIPFPGAIGSQSTLSGLALSSDGSTVYAVSQSTFDPTGNYLTPVSVATRTAGTSIHLNLSYVSDLALAADGATAYVISATGGTVESVDLTTGVIGHTTSVDAPSVGLMLAGDVQATGPQAPQGTLSDTVMSGVTDDTTNPTVQLTVAQKDAEGAAIDPSTLTVTATSSKENVIPSSGVQIGGTGATRTVTLTPTGVGYSTITFTVSGAGGKTSTTTLDYASSAGAFPGARWLFGFSDQSSALDVGDGYILSVDDERGEVGLFRSDRSGPPVKAFPIQAASGIGNEIDYESMARAGDTVYIAGSMGNDKTGIVAPTRQTVFATTITGSGADTQLTYAASNTNLRTDLVSWDNANGKPLNLQQATSGAPKGNDGFNVEGLEFAPDSTSTAYLGFRAPIRGGKALIVPVTNFDRLLAGTDAHGAFGAPIWLDLGGRSIRELRKNSNDEYLILAGGSDFSTVGGSGEALYRWDGVATHAPKLITGTQLPTDDTTSYDDGPMAWEGIAAVPHPLVDGAHIKVLGDVGYNYLYGGTHTAKNLSEANWRKSPVIDLTLSGVPAADPTAPASALPATAVTASSATLGAQLGPDVTAYQVLYRESGETAWSATERRTVTGTGPVSETVGALAPMTLHYYKVRAFLPGGVLAYSPVLSFRTGAAALGAADLVVGSVSDLSTTAVTFNATVDTHGAATSGVVEWGTQAGTYTKVTPLYAAGPANARVLSRSLTGLVPGREYHYRITVTNPVGAASSEDRTFTTATPPAPLVTIGAVSPVAANTATLNTVVDTKGSLVVSTSVQWGTTTSYGKSLPLLPGALLLEGGRTYTRPLISLKPGTTYHYKVTVTTEHGTYESTDRTFTTTA